MSERLKGILIVGCAAASFFAGATWRMFYDAKPVSAPVIVAPVEPDDSWVDRRLGMVDRYCGPVPWHAAMTREWIEVDCGRPERIKPLRMPAPRVEITKVAEVAP